MAFDMLTIDGVNPLSAPVFATDCAFPITNWITYMPGDDVLQNMPIRLGNWADGTIAPQIVSASYAIVTTGAVSDACTFPVVSGAMTTCDQVVPNMAEVGVQSDLLNIREMAGDFCRRRRILPEQLCVFDQSGNFAPGEDVMFGRPFFNFVMNELITSHATWLYHSALVGDDSNPFEFDGLYTQLTGGWGVASGSPGNCSADLNTEAVIDWGALTGIPTGAGPGEKTAAGATVTIWGTTFDVEAGLTLPEVLDRYWFSKVEHDWTANRGGVTQWELHMPYGQWACAARAAACVQPCSPNEVVAYINDADLRNRYIAMNADKAITFFPSQRRLPVFESNLMPANTWRLGPRSVGGRPTYGLFFDDLDRYYSNFGVATIDGAYGYPSQTGFFPPITAPDIRAQLEARAIHWDIFRTTPKCFRASIMAVAGMIVCSRHLWLRIDNVNCANWLDARPFNVTVDGTVLS